MLHYFKAESITLSPAISKTTCRGKVTASQRQGKSVQVNYYVWQENVFH